MKTSIFVLIFLLVIGLWWAGRSDWHLDRNKHNQLPKGLLKKVVDKDNIFLDEAGKQWELLPHSKNIFHQPDHEIEEVDKPYPNIVKAPKLDTKNSNLKFLHALENGASYEAIVQPNGKFLTIGKKRGTYNYGHPSGLTGTLKHVILDVLPHFINDNYRL